MGLGKLIVLYDDNNISIDGKVDGWFTENIPQRFESYGWHVVPNVNYHDTAAIQTTIEAARAETGKPSIICCKTLIGKGSANKEGSHKTHGAPLGADEIEATRKHLGWAYPAFEIPQEIYDAWNAKEKARNWKPDGTNCSRNIKPNILPKPQNSCAAWIKSCRKTLTSTFRRH